MQSYGLVILYEERRVYSKLRPGYSLCGATAWLFFMMSGVFTASYSLVMLYEERRVYSKLSK